MDKAECQNDKMSFQREKKQIKWFYIDSYSLRMQGTKQEPVELNKTISKLKTNSLVKISS